MLYDFAGDADPIVTPIRDAGISQIIGQLRDYLDASSGGNAPKWTTTNWAV
jgi:hypothetical protein